MAIFGDPPYAPGTPAVTSTGVRSVPYKDPHSGAQSGSRKIDPVTGDYVIDPVTGQSVGMSDAQQLVLLAIKTARGSSAMRDLGQELLTIKKIGPSFNLQVDTILRRAVKHIVDRGIIEVYGTIVAVVRPGVVFVSLKWRDLTTRRDDSTPVGEFSIGG